MAVEIENYDDDDNEIDDEQVEDSYESGITLKGGRQGCFRLEPAAKRLWLRRLNWEYLTN